MDIAESFSLETLKKSFIEISNSSSSFSQYYHSTDLFSAVIETYRTDLVKPYLKMSSFSPTKSKNYLFDDESFLEKISKRAQHQHDFFELMFVLSGEVTVKIEDTERVYSAGTGCIVNCNLRHAELFSNDFRLFFLNLSPSYLRELLSYPNMFHPSSNTDFSEDSAFHFFEENISEKVNAKKEYLDFFPTYSNSDSYKKLYHICEEIVVNTISPQIGSSFIINGLICQLIAAISDKTFFHLSTVDVDYGNDFLIFTKLTHLFEDSDGRLSRSELSNILNYSGDYLNRIVKKYTGMSLFEYGTTFCLKKAEYYLLKTNYSVAAIIVMLGFTNKSHFYSLFSKHFGITPNEYREKHLS